MKLNKLSVLAIALTLLAPIGLAYAVDIDGTEGPDIINKDSGFLPEPTQLSDKIVGKEGDDEMHGLAGDDEIIGEKGNDQAFGGTGNDKPMGYYFTS